MNLYVIKDTSSVKVLDVFSAHDDNDARLRMAQALYACNNPIGLDKRILCRAAAINFETGLVVGEKEPVQIVALNVLFDDVLKERKKYGK